MANPRRIAAALQYQKSKPDWFDAVPVADAPATQRVAQPLPMTWLDRLNNLSAGLGTGITNQLEGYRQMVADPVQAAKDIGSAVGTIVQNPSVILESVKAMGQKAGSGAQGLGEVLGENMTLNPRRLAMALSHPNVSELTVYHGTPHRFPATEANPLGEFDASKIGTGEGAQAYGHGLYLAENPGVAGAYRNVLSDTLEVVGNADPLEKRAAQMALTFGGNTPEGALNWLSKFEGKGAGHTSPAMTPELVAKVKQKFENGTFKQGGSLYHVDLPDEMIDKMLDWDKPLSEQSVAAKEALKKLPGKEGELSIKDLIEAMDAAPHLRNQADYPAVNLSIQEIYRNLGKGNMVQNASKGQAQASEALRQLGIPGIRYLDAGSRDAATGTRNFVIFPGEEKNLKILERK